MWWHYVFIRFVKYSGELIEFFKKLSLHIFSPIFYGRWVVEIESVLPGILVLVGARGPYVWDEINNQDGEQRSSHFKY